MKLKINFYSIISNKANVSKYYQITEQIYKQATGVGCQLLLPSLHIKMNPLHQQQNTILLHKGQSRVKHPTVPVSTIARSTCFPYVPCQITHVAERYP